MNLKEKSSLRGAEGEGERKTKTKEKEKKKVKKKLFFAPNPRLFSDFTN